jgi:putative component of toxin-antitoxin plasmid stabilization module
MTFDDYLNSIEDDQPSARLSETLASLWWDKKGDWDTAHSIAQEIPTAQGSAVHAYLHREEGVLWNADYWYSRAGRQRPDIPLEEEWIRLVEEMLKAL